MKTFKFGIAWEEYGHATVEVPDDYTEEQAKEYVLKNWDKIPLPTDHEYMEDSDNPDFEYAEFLDENENDLNNIMESEMQLKNAKETFNYYINLFEKQFGNDKACIEAAAKVMQSSFKPSRTEMMQIIQELAPKASSYPPGDYAISIMKKVDETYPEILREREASEETALKR